MFSFLNSNSLTHLYTKPLTFTVFSLVKRAVKLNLKFKQHLWLEDCFKSVTYIFQSLFPEAISDTLVCKCQVEVITTSKMSHYTKTLMSVTTELTKIHICKITSIVKFVIIYLHARTYHQYHKRLVEILTHETSDLCTRQSTCLFTSHNHYLLHHTEKYSYTNKCLISLDMVLQLHHFT
jgi:hypothetical protein